MHMMCSSNSQVVVAITLILAVTLAGQSAEAARAFFIFGDSLVDNGNNNFLATTARADMPPYGIDFPTHRATGRFSNGYNIPDLISQNLGAESTLAYLDPQLTGEKLLVGANFASAGIGILNDTGVQFANIIRIYQQLDYFSQYQQRVTELIGPEGAQNLVNGALSLIVLGGNDYVNNYFLNPPLTGRRFQMNLQEFSVLLITEYRKILQRLFDLGARRVLVTGTGPIGCVPAELASSGSQNGECSPEPMRAAEIFNPMLIEMLQELNRDIGGDVFVAANANQMQHNFISNPEDFGFVNSKVACCGQGPYNGIGVCTVVSNLCQNREDYVFWDPFHPSEKANRIIVQTLFQGSQEYMTPMNLSTIMELDSKM